MRLLREPMSNVVFLQARTVGALFFIVYSPRYFRAFIDMVQIVDAHNVVIDNKMGWSNKVKKQRLHQQNDDDMMLPLNAFFSTTLLILTIYCVTTSQSARVYSTTFHHYFQ